MEPVTSNLESQTAPGRSHSSEAEANNSENEANIKPSILALDDTEDEIEIKIQILDSNKLCSQKVKLSTSIQEVKRKIQDEHDIPYNKQILILQDSEMVDERTFSHYIDKIQKGSFLFLTVLAINIVIKIQSLEEGENCWEAHYYFDREDTIGDIKAKIQKDKGIAYYQQILLNQGEPLEDTATIKSTGIEQNNTLFLELTIQIIVKDESGKTWCFNTRRNSEIRAIKDYIFERELIPGHSQILWFTQTNDRVQLEAHKTLADYKIGHKNVLELQVLRSKKIKVFVASLITLTDKTIALDCLLDDTIQVLKVKISHLMQIPTNELRLFYAGKSLEDDAQVSKYNIFEGSTLHLTLNSMGAISVKNENSVILYYWALRDYPEFFYDLKKEIERKKNIPIAEQLLLTETHCLCEFGEKPSFYNIKDGSVLFVIDQRRIKRSNAKIQEKDPYHHLTAKVLGSIKPPFVPWDPKIETLEKLRFIGGKKPESNIADEEWNFNKYNGDMNERLLWSSDRREIVNMPDNFPYCAIVALEILFRNQDNTESTFLGTGIMVGPHYILTAAHNVYSKDHPKKWADEIKALFSIDVTKNSYGNNVSVSLAIIPDSWVQNDRESDLAILVLESNVGKYTGWVSVSQLKEDQLFTRKFVIAGHGLQVRKNGGKEVKEKKLMRMTGRITMIGKNLLNYDADTDEGQSGSPVFSAWEKDYHPEIVGIHVRGASNYNEGIRISEDHFEWIRFCMRKWGQKELRESISS